MVEGRGGESGVVAHANQGPTQYTTLCRGNHHDGVSARMVPSHAVGGFERWSENLIILFLSVFFAVPGSASFSAALTLVPLAR